MSKPSSEHRFKQATLPGSRIDDEMVFFNQSTGKYYGTGAVGAQIWDMLDTPKTISEICDALLLKFDIDRTTCEGQVATYLSDLLESGIIIELDGDT